MGPLENQRHERFALFVAGGDVDATAYRKAFKCKQATAEANATRMRDNDGIKARIAELMGKAAEGHVMTKREEMEYLTKGATTPVGDVDEKSPLCQSYKINADGTKEFKMVDKMRCIDLLAKMKAEFPPMEQAAAPVNVSVNVTVMSEDRRAELMTKKRRAIEKRRGITANN